MPAQEQPQAYSPFSVAAKRPSDTDFASMGSQPPLKKPNVRQEFQHAPPFVVPDNELDSQSEGEIVDETEGDAMELGLEAEQPFQEDDQPSETPATSPVLLNRPAPNGPGSDQLYRAKQSEIDAMRRKIAEMEQRNKLKRTKSHVESPVSSNAPTPAIPREDQPLNSSPIAQTIGLGGSDTQRQPSAPRNLTKLTPAQLKERTAALKADLLKQRAQRQQMLQEGLPDLNAEVEKTETRLDNSSKELVRVRARIQSLRAELDQLLLQEKSLDEEVSRFEQQLQEGLAGQKQYSDELQQINLEKLAEEEIAPAQQEPMEIAAAQTATEIVPEALPGLSNGDAEIQDPTLTDDRNLPTVVSEIVVTDELPNAEKNHGFGAEIVNEIPTSYQIQAPSPEEAEPTEYSEVAEREDEMEADEMEISPEPEEFEEPHEVLPVTLEATQESNEGMDEVMDVDDDSDGSASMSGSDDEEDEYEPADVDSSQPMQHSEDDEEYDPESAPVESGTPTTGAEDGNEDFHEASEVMDATETVPTPADMATPVERVSAASDGSESQPSPAQEEASMDVETVSEVPADTLDDLETNALSTEADAMVKAPPWTGREPPEVHPILDGSAAPNVHYVPYKTPLSSFKSYRFHPEYSDTVKSGYRSLTYSNNIDPSRPLCPAELSGQVCTDQHCEEQHFSQLGLPDDKILVQMSSAGDIKDKATRDDFHAGLKQVIADLRAGEVKDFEKVADALSKYRRTFFAERVAKENEVQEAEGQEPVQQEEQPPEAVES